jgi:hypothetical protein
MSTGRFVGVISPPKAIKSRGQQLRMIAALASLMSAIWFLPTAAANGETIVAPFTGGPYATTTKFSYSGPVELTVKGYGQSAGTQFSDAFYIFTNESGQPRTPEHLPNQSLCINGSPVDVYLTSIPVYDPEHKYTFVIEAPGGPLTFGPCDGFTSDNTGEFKIKVRS